MFYVSESAFFQDEHNLPPSPLDSNSSGWPSLINMHSTVSLLSSYTPQASSQQQHLLEEKGCLVLSPINDVDECFKGKQKKMYFSLFPPLPPPFSFYLLPNCMNLVLFVAKSWTIRLLRRAGKTRCRRGHV